MLQKVFTGRRLCYILKVSLKTQFLIRIQENQEGFSVGAKSLPAYVFSWKDPKDKVWS